MDVLCESEGRAVEILGRERRRRWTEAEKLEILAAVEAPGETLAHVARRYDVSRSQIYNWRHQFKKSGRLPAPVGVTFLPVDIGAPMLKAEPAPAGEASVVSPSIVELGLAQGRCLRFDSGIEGATLTRLIRSVEAA
jgi:transposase